MEESYQSCRRLILHKLKFLGTGFGGTQSGDICVSAISVVVAPFLCLLGYIVCRLVIEKLFVVSNIWNNLLKLFERLLLIIVIVNYLLVTMSFQVEDFTASP